MKLLKTLCFGLFLLLLSGCSSEELHGSIVVINGNYYEIQHRFLDAYVLHKLNPDEIEKLKINASILKD